MKNNSQMIIRKGFRPRPSAETVVKETTPVVEKPVHRVDLLARLRVLPGAWLLLLKLKFVKMLLKLRNQVPKILVHPDKRLKRIAEPVDFENTTRDERVAVLRKMAAALAQTGYGMRLGIAAPQVGINKRVIIVRGNVMFNPTWTPTKAPKELIQEACYSCPGKIYKVGRAPYGWARWTNIDGKPFEDKITGLPAIVFQHELDHLDGKCCADVGEEISEVPGRIPPEFTNPKQR